MVCTMRKLMERMDKAHTSIQGGDIIYVAKHLDRFTKKKSLMFVVKTKDGEYTPPMLRPFTKTQKEDLEFLEDYGEEINEYDRIMISKFLTQNFENLKTIESKDRMSIKEVFNAIYQYCRDNKINNSDGYYNIATEDFNDIIVGCGHKPLYIKKIMVQNEMLRTTTGRAYDYNIKVPDNNGELKNKWHISININVLEEEINENSKTDNEIKTESEVGT